MVIQWSAQDDAYVVSFPEWEAAGHIAHTHGTTYEDAVARGREALELLIESAAEVDVQLPRPQMFPAERAV
jgi:predicted RNase H-like HicB family nuclease